jgi:hypothetical protein
MARTAMNMREVRFRTRDFGIAFAVSIPAGAFAAVIVAIFSFQGSAGVEIIAVAAAIIGLFCGPIAACGAALGYAIARLFRIRSRWVFAAIVGLGAGLALVAVVVCLTAAQMDGFVSETVDGHPSNPWLDSLSTYPIAFVASFIPAYLWIVSIAGYRFHHQEPGPTEAPPDGQPSAAH